MNSSSSPGSLAGWGDILNLSTCHFQLSRSSAYILHVNICLVFVQSCHGLYVGIRLQCMHLSAIVMGQIKDNFIFDRCTHGGMEENLKMSTINKYVINDGCENAYEDR